MEASSSESVSRPLCLLSLKGKVPWLPPQGLAASPATWIQRLTLHMDFLTFSLSTLGKDPVFGDYPNIEKHFAAFEKLVPYLIK